MIFAFAPLAGLLLGVSDIQVPWFTLFLSVTLYVLIPLTAGVLTRIYVTHRYSNQALSEWISKLKPFSIVGLLLTVFILFALQSQTIINSPQTIFMIAIPLLLQTYCIFFITYYFAVKLRLPFKIAAPAAMIGTSNFFELAVAVAISLFGLYSGAALATVVGVLVEVPVMLSLVAIANHTQHWFSQYH